MSNFWLLTITIAGLVAIIFFIDDTYADLGKRASKERWLRNRRVRKVRHYQNDWPSPMDGWKGRGSKH